MLVVDPVSFSYLPDYFAHILGHTLTKTILGVTTQLSTEVTTANFVSQPPEISEKR